MCSSDLDRASPTQPVRPIFAEALGMTDDRSPYVYLSDGGHFDNLGLYAMVLRRCRVIVVSDASTDPDYQYQSLAQAIRQIKMDLGVPIEMGPMSFGNNLEARTSRRNRYCAMGIIRYSAVDKPVNTDPDPDYDGVLIYIKPSLNGSEPRDVLSYRDETNGFPQDAAGDEGFSDPQFESYRRLGSHMIETICTGGVGAANPFENFENQARAHVDARARSDVQRG